MALLIGKSTSNPAFAKANKTRKKGCNPFFLVLLAGEGIGEWPEERGFVKNKVFDEMGHKGAWLASRCAYGVWKNPKDFSMERSDNTKCVAQAGRWAGDSVRGALLGKIVIK